MTLKRTRLPGIPTLICLILLHPPAGAQPALTAAILEYTRSQAAGSRLYNGPLYLGYDRQTLGHPFFLSDSLLSGSIDYDGIHYPALSLSYDIAKDLVIIPDKKNSTFLQLLTEKLPAFTIGPNRFIYLAPDSNAINAPEPGFYQLLYSGKARALAHHRKVIDDNGRADENKYRYHQYDTWYLEMHDRYIPVHSQKNLLSAFGAGDKGLRNILRSKNISFKKDPAAALTTAAELLSQTNN